MCSGRKVISLHEIESFAYTSVPELFLVQGKSCMAGEHTRDILPLEFFEQPTDVVARLLLGCTLVRRLGDTEIAGRIVETEAYMPVGDEANHAYRGKTPRNAAMFGPAGILYVYKIYGIHHCVNVVTEAEGQGCAVLIRAVEPVAGIPAMQQRRGVNEVDILCNGPGKLAQAFGFTRTDSFTPLDGLDVCIRSGGGVSDDRVGVTSRIGLSKAVELPLRFFVRGNPHVSGGKRYVF